MTAVLLYDYIIFDVICGKKRLIYALCALRKHGNAFRKVSAQNKRKSGSSILRKSTVSLYRKQITEQMS
jgi:hypothetical protein